MRDVVTSDQIMTRRELVPNSGMGINIYNSKNGMTMTKQLPLIPCMIFHNLTAVFDDQPTNMRLGAQQHANEMQGHEVGFLNESEFHTHISTPRCWAPNGKQHRSRPFH